MLLFQLGYSFETGDQLQYLLLPYRELFTAFLPGDWFTWHTSHYHVSFSWLVQTVHALTGPAWFARGMFAVHFANLGWFGIAVWRLAFALGLGPLEASGCVAVLALIRQVALAGALVNHAGLVPADLALAPFLLACAAYGERRNLAMGAWLGISGLLHANYAVLGPLVLFPLVVWRERHELRVRTWVGPIASYVGLASPSLWLLLGTFLARDASPQAVSITLFVRSPHHYDLASMRPDEWYFAAVLTTLGAGHFLAWSRARPVTCSLAHVQLTAALFACVALAVVGSGLHIVPLARLFAWRMSVPLYVSLLLAAAAILRARVRARDLTGSSTMLIGYGVLLTFAQRDPLEASPWNAEPTLAGCVVALLIAARVAEHMLSGRLRTSICILASVVAVALALRATLPANSVGPELWSRLHLLDARVAIDPPVRNLFTAIRQRTPNDARFLIAPGQSQFRMHARRAVFVDWKCAPMKGDEALEWKRRMLLTMRVSEFPAKGYSLPHAADRLYYARPLNELAQLARAEGLTHVLARRSNPKRPDSGLRQVFSLGDYIVLAL